MKRITKLIRITFIVCWALASQNLNAQKLDKVYTSLEEALKIQI